MRASIRTLILAAATAVLAAARPAAEPNPLSIVIANGPFTGTYKAKEDEVICLHSKKDKMYAASFKDFEETTARQFAEGGLKVSNPDVAGPKRGDLYVAFGPNDKRTVEYNVFDVPITMTAKGKGVDFVGSGKTKDGVQIRVTASCVDVMTM